MYGLVNRALQELICNRFGEAVWDDIREQAGVDEEVFVRMDGYPDEITYNLVGVASGVLGIPAEQLLKEFGRHWILYTAAEGYGDLLDGAGADFMSFLSNLDSMHARVGLLFPDLRPPSFRCSDMTADSVVLHYHSSRAGLSPMVIGLVEGLGERFGQKVAIEQRDDRGRGADHDTYFIRILGAAGSED